MGAEEDLLTYATDLDALYRAAVEADTIDSNLGDVSTAVTVPETPEACSSITNPLYNDIQNKIVELTDFLDCVEFTTGHVCTEIDATVVSTIADNVPRLEAKGLEVVAKLNRLYPVIGEEDEDRATFAERILGEFLVALEAGDAENVEADFDAPSDLVPIACGGFGIDYTDLNKLITDFAQACSFDAYL